ncbi:hypothetical protein ABW20_dc0110202 [Dactylellina cionopaga]|nr:hypothetical protein ABW20_dc0110202 [Dactylellina cionopaga]
MVQFSTLAACSILVALAPSVSGHCVFLSVQGLTSKGEQGGPVGQALAVNPSVPRNGVALDPNQADTTIFNERVSMKLWTTCGSSVQGGHHDALKLTTRLFDNGQVAQAMAGGQLMMLLHQINGDGNGPFRCGLDLTATAKKGTFTKELDIYTQIPGNNPVANTVVTTQFPLVVNLPKGLKCTGSFKTTEGVVKKNVCMMRCQNNATNGPFGGCIPFVLVPTLRSNFKRQAPPQMRFMKRDDDPTPPKVGDLPPTDGPGPEMAKPPSADKIAEMAKKLLPPGVNSNPVIVVTEAAPAGSNSTVATTPVNVDDIVATLTEGETMKPEEIASLKVEVAKEIAAGTLPPRTKQRSKEHKFRKTRTRNRNRKPRLQVPKHAPPGN